jgi:DNA-binding CsgD family transcriptional regulator
VDLLERGVQLGAIALRLDAASRGEGALILVEGEAGIGKTSVLRAAAEVGRTQGMRTLWASASELEREVPYGVVRQLFERGLSKAERRAVLSGAARLARVALEPGARHEGGAAEAFAVRHGLYWMTVNLAERAPLLLTVDDASWVDEPSMRWLAYLARRIERLAVVMLLSVRTGEPDSSWEPLMALASESTSDSLELPPLSSVATAELVRQRIGVPVDDRLCADCHAASGGNPLLIDALLDALDAEGAAALTPRLSAEAARRIRPSLVRRIGRLPQAARTLAEAVALLGDGASLAEAAALADLPLERAAAAADDLTSAGLFAAQAALTFAHPLVREVVYSDIGEHVLAVRHADAARLLSERGAEASRIAMQALRALPSGDPAISAALRAAAADAISAGEPATAVRYLRRALDEARAPERPQVMLELGMAELTSGHPTAVDDLREAATDVALTAEQRLKTTLGLWEGLIWAGRMDEARGALEDLRQKIKPSDREQRLTLKAYALVMPNMVITARDERDTLLEDARSEDVDGKTPAERLLLAARAMREALSGSPASKVLALSQAAMGPSVAIDVISDPGWIAPLIFAPWLAGDPQASDRVANAAIELARQTGSASLLRMLAPRAIVRMAAGRLADAETDASEALTLDLPLGPVFHSMAVGSLVTVTVEHRQLKAAKQLIAAHQPLLQGPLVHLLHAKLALVRLSLAGGMTRDAVALLHECGDLAQAGGVRSPTFAPWRSLLALADRDSADAHPLAEEELQLARACETPGAEGVALRALGLLEGGRAGVARLELAVERLAQSQQRLEYARALVDLGAALRRAGQRTTARDPLRQGIDLAQRCGGTALVERGVEELRASGARPRRLAAIGTNALTPAERRVAQFAARGLSNREIAQALFVTTKTVETHLGHIYEKLSISRRTELAAALGTEGSGQPVGEAAHA